VTEIRKFAVAGRMKTRGVSDGDAARQHRRLHARPLPDKALAEALAIPGGLPVDELHVTVA